CTWFCCSLCCVAFFSRLTLCYKKFYCDRRLYLECFAGMRYDRNIFILFYKLQRISDDIRSESDLVKCLIVHNVGKSSIVVQILHLFSFNMRILELLCWTESFLNNTAALDVL